VIRTSFKTPRELPAKLPSSGGGCWWTLLSFAGREFARSEDRIHLANCAAGTTSAHHPSGPVQLISLMSRDGELSDRGTR
jgi:hypothetical protein